MRPELILITPALASANNGNWQTAARWQRALRGHWRVRIEQQWSGQPAELMIALHARRSADSIRRFAATGRAVGLVLTGTDLYRDIDTDTDARNALEQAHSLIVLNRHGARRLPEHLHHKLVVITQSAPPRKPLPPRRRSFDLLLVGHLREEKDPMTAARAVARLPDRNLRLIHIGRNDDLDTGAQFRAAAEKDQRIELRGPLAHGRTRMLIRRGRVLLLPSRMEGGANALIEAVQSAIPVLASRIDGSTGLIGDDYPGLFPVGDDRALSELIEACQSSPNFCDRLVAHADQFADQFEPQHEAELVRQVASKLLEHNRLAAAR